MPSDTPKKGKETDSSIERRAFKMEELRVVNEEGQPTRIVGLAVPYGSLSVDMQGFKEIFLPGAFKQSLAEDEVFADVEHDRSHKLGRTSRQTLVLREEARGLVAEIVMPKTTLGRDVAEEVRSGTTDAMSIAFSRAKDIWEGEEPDLVRVVREAKLHAVTLTSYPAYLETAGMVALRSLEEHRAAAKGEGETGEERTEDEPAEVELLKKRLDLAEAE